MSSNEVKDEVKDEVNTSSKRRKFVFLAGLPRSGSTLLSCLLNQNPDFLSRGSSPVVGFMKQMEINVNQSELFQADPKPKEAEAMITSLLENYYKFDTEKKVIVDKNRNWMSHIDDIKHYGYSQDPKIICTYRNIYEIISSFLCLIKKSPNNTYDKSLTKAGKLLTDENRCKHVLDILCVPLAKEFVKASKRPECLLVPYKSIVDNPPGVLEKVYEFLGEPKYQQHEFKNLKNDHRERDKEVYGLPDLHKVRSTISKTCPLPIDVLPDGIIQHISNHEGLKEYHQVIQMLNK